MLKDYKHFCADHYNSNTTSAAGGASLPDPASSEPLILFSGDCFNPSITSTVTKGSHMVPVLNLMGVHVAMIGNHDLDFGLDVAGRLIDRMNFPWLLSNVFDGLSGESISNTVTYKLLHFKGAVIGLMGLAEAEWIDTLPKLPEHGKGLRYIDFIEEGRRMAKFLREQCGAHIVIALTHMREPNDVKLAAEAPEIDLILGGHDHLYAVHHVPPRQSDGSAEPEAGYPADKVGGLVVKSGNDFRNLTLIRTFFKTSQVASNVLKLCFITFERLLSYSQLFGAVLWLDGRMT